MQKVRNHHTKRSYEALLGERKIKERKKERKVSEPVFSPLPSRIHWNLQRKERGEREREMRRRETGVSPGELQLHMTELKKSHKRAGACFRQHTFHPYNHVTM